jgi:hypothetical protein
MIAAGLSKDFGVLASDSAMYSTDDGSMTFESGKLSCWQGKYLISFIGTRLYFSRIDPSKFGLPLNGLSLYLQGYLRGMKPDIGNMMKELIEDPDENKPNFCLYVLGLHGKKPTLAQFNSFVDFKPRFLWTEGEGVQFSTILYGDDSKPEKAELFKETTKFMEELAKGWKENKVSGEKTSFTPGLIGEILARGIYKKADLEMKIGLKKKYAGGIVNAAGFDSEGRIIQLSGIEFLSQEVPSGRR